MLLVGLAGAQDPDDDGLSDVDVTIYVYGDEALREARNEVIRSMESIGWLVVSDGEETVFAPPQRWIGRAVFTSDGRMAFREPIAVPSVNIGGFDLLDRQPFAQRSLDVCANGPQPDRDILSAALPDPIPQGPIRLTVTLYADASQQQQLWTETHLTAVLHDRYSVDLGTLVPIDAHTRANGRWLVASVGGRDVLSAPTADLLLFERPNRYIGHCNTPEQYDPMQPEAWVQPPLMGMSFQFPSKRKRSPHQRQALDATTVSVADYRTVLQETATRRHVDTLIVKLDRLWDSGRALYGDQLIPTPDQRRQTVLELWASRATNRSGELVCAAIEDWLYSTVLHSAAPITQDEYAHYESQRSDGRRLPRL